MSDADDLRAHMSEAEQNLLRRYFEKSNIALEFGCGGSTYIAAQSGLRKLYSVDSSVEWIDRCLANNLIARRVERHEFFFHHAQIGETVAYGRPRNKDGLALWPSYSLGVWQRFSDGSPDFVLIDGRFRVSCAYQALLHIPGPLTVVFHDFWSRPSYQVVLDFYQASDHVDDMVVLTPKEHYCVRSLGIQACHYLMEPE